MSGFARWLSSEAAGLAIIGLLSLARGLSYLPVFVDANRRPAHWLEGLLPVDAWAVVWIALGVFCIVAGWVPRLIAPAVGAAIALHTLWALSYFVATFADDRYRSWVSSLGYLGIALLAAWGFGRGRAGEVRIEKE